MGRKKDSDFARLTEKLMSSNCMLFINIESVSLDTSLSAILGTQRKVSVDVAVRKQTVKVSRKSDFWQMTKIMTVYRCCPKLFIPYENSNRS